MTKVAIHHLLLVSFYSLQSFQRYSFVDKLYAVAVVATPSRQTPRTTEVRRSALQATRLVYLQKCNYNIVVSGIRFEWDEAKNLSNQRKHGVSFEEASQVFLDPLFVSLKERIEDGEQRWQTYGEVKSCLLVMVAHTVREVDEHGETVEVMRIIPARYASRKERQRYEAENR